MMEIRQLRYFVAVAEELHFTRASARLKISPPSLTEQIQRLEAELGVRLLHRTKRAVSLTDAGANFLKEARSALLHAERAAVVARRAGRGEIGRVEIGYVSSASCTGLLTKAVAEYRLSHPLVQLVIRKIETARQLEQIAEEKLDLGFLRPPDHYPAGIGSIVLARQPLILALPESHRLASRKIVATKELVGESFIAPSFEMEHGIFRHTEELGRQAGFVPKIVERAPDFITIVTMVAAGFGIAIVPKSCDRIQIPGIAYRNLTPQARPAELSAAFRQEERSPAVMAFIEHLKAKVRKIRP
ncbi:MAG: LysR substrate-binding domain-containing protein [Croceibacterium sp.]